MGGEQANISAKESAEAMFKLLTQSSDLKSGGFYDYQGNNIAW